MDLPLSRRYVPGLQWIQHMLTLRLSHLYSYSATGCCEIRKHSYSRPQLRHSTKVYRELQKCPTTLPGSLLWNAGFITIS
jgi:hypothetical protein